MQNQPPPGYQPGGWQQQTPYSPQPPMVPQRPRTQTFNMEENVASGLCYLPFLFLHFILPIIFLTTEPKTNRFVRFHAAQAITLALTGFVGGIGGYVIGMLTVVLFTVGAAATQSPAAAVFGIIVGVLVALALVGFGIFMLVCTITACVKAFQGKLWKVPVIGNFAERFV